MSETTYFCPTCGSAHVATAHEQLFMVNTGEHYCHSVKPHDANSRAVCLDCRWEGQREQLDTELSQRAAAFKKRGDSRDQN